MVEVIHWCLELGVPAMSFYAFSIDNFKRSPQEVADLMALAEEKYTELMRVHGFCIAEPGLIAAVSLSLDTAISNFLSRAAATMDV